MKLIEKEIRFVVTRVGGRKRLGGGRIKWSKYTNLQLEDKYLGYMCMRAQSCLTFTTPWTVACQSPLSMGFPRQEY